MRPTRRVVLGALSAFTLPLRAHADSSEETSADADEGSVALTRYAAQHSGQRPAVLVLHGARGLELNPGAYKRYAERLAAEGIDAFLVQYFTTRDYQALDPKVSTPESRDSYNTGRFAGWVKRISSVVTTVLARPESSGRLGLLGFSLGGYVAADTAVHDERIMALAILYGGMTNAMVAQVKHMPPLLEIHGKADRNVPVAKGEELVKLAQAVGAPAEQIVYPDRGHGFDFSDTDPMTADAVGRVARFFQARLNSHH